MVPSTATVPNIPINATITRAAARGIHELSARTNGTAITAAVVAAPKMAKTCVARWTTITATSVTTMKNPKNAKPRADTTTA
jgi:hypothetical protein